MKNQNLQTWGLKVQADQLEPTIVKVDSSFEKCPIAHAAGIPLYVKRLFDQPRKKSNNYIIVRMMSDPKIGLAPMDWQYGGCLEPAPTVLMARNDGTQFNVSDWEVLDDFQMEMLDDGPRKVTRQDFIQFVLSGYKQSEANIVLEVLYPKGAQCKAQGLTLKKQLNGKTGVCTGLYENGRVGVRFKEQDKVYGLKAENLALTKG